MMNMTGSPQLSTKERIEILRMKRNELAASNPNSASSSPLKVSIVAVKHDTTETDADTKEHENFSPEKGNNQNARFYFESKSTSPASTPNTPSEYAFSPLPADRSSVEPSITSQHPSRGRADSDEIAAAKRIPIAERIASFRASASTKVPGNGIADKVATSSTHPTVLQRAPSVKERIASLRTASSKEGSSRDTVSKTYQENADADKINKRESTGSSISAISSENDTYSRPTSLVRVSRTASEIPSYAKSKHHKKSASMDSNAGRRTARALVPVRETESASNSPVRRPKLQHASLTGSIEGVHRNRTSSSLVREQDMSLVILGHGFFGPTYHMKLENGNEYAVKIIDGSLLRKAGTALSELQSEVSKLAKISHGYLGKYFGMYRRNDADEVHVIMQYLPGRTLEEQLSVHPLLSPSIILSCLKQLADVLLFMHDTARIAHGYLTPASIIIDEDFNLKLCNVRFRSLCSDSLTASIKIAATPYSSYEQQFGLPFDAIDDMWAVGCIAAELFAGTTFRDILSSGSIAHSRVEASSLRREALFDACSICGERCKELVMLLLDVNRSKRMTASEMRSFLEDFESQMMWTDKTIAYEINSCEPFASSGTDNERFVETSYESCHGSNDTDTAYLLLSPDSKYQATLMAEWLADMGMMTAHSAIALATELLTIHCISTVDALADACAEDESFLTEKLMLFEEDAAEITKALIIRGLPPQQSLIDLGGNSSHSSRTYELTEFLPSISGTEEVTLFRNLFSASTGLQFFCGTSPTIARKKSFIRGRGSSNQSIVLAQQLRCHEGTLQVMKFSRSGKFLCTAGEGSKVSIWAVAAHPTVTSRGRDEPSPSHNTEYTGAVANSFGVADFLVPTPFCVLDNHQDGIIGASWSGGDRLLTASSDNSVCVWNIVRQECLLHMTHEDKITSMEFHPDLEDTFITGDATGKLICYGLNSNSVEHQCQIDIQIPISAVTFSNDGSLIAVGLISGIVKIYGCRFAAAGDNNASTSNFNTYVSELVFMSELSCRKGSSMSRGNTKINGLRFTKQQPNEGHRLDSNMQLLVTTSDGKIRLFNIANGWDHILMKKFKGNSALKQISADASAGGESILSGSDSGDVYLWNNRDGVQEGISVGCTGKENLRVYPHLRISHSTSTTQALFAPPEVVSRFLHVTAAVTNRSELLDPQVYNVVDGNEGLDSIGQSMDSHDSTSITLNNISRSESTTHEYSEKIDHVYMRNVQQKLMEGSMKDETTDQSFITSLYGSAAIFTASSDGIVNVFVLMKERNFKKHNVQEGKLSKEVKVL